MALNETFSIKEDTTVEEITSYFQEKHGLVYENYIQETIERLDKLQDSIANWMPQDFEYLAIDGGNQVYRIDEENDRAVLVDDSGPSIDVCFFVWPVNQSKVLNLANVSDPLQLSNYGRPYNEQNRPTGHYYPYAKSKLIPNFANETPKAAM